VREPGSAIAAGFAWGSAGNLRTASLDGEGGRSIPRRDDGLGGVRRSTGNIVAIHSSDPLADATPPCL